MKLLLTSGGITNASLRHELVELIGKPLERSRALLVPTAQWGQPACSPETVWRTTAGSGEQDALVALGWQSIGVLELTALPTIPRERWTGWVREADVLLVDGGEAVYLAEWVTRSGLGELLTTLPDLVWVGVSAGSMALTPRIGTEFVDAAPGGGDATLGLVGFSIFPHLDYPGWASNTLERAREWAAGVGGRAYAIDDQTGISVAGDVERVVSEGAWELLRP